MALLKILLSLVIKSKTQLAVICTALISIFLIWIFRIRSISISSIGGGYISVLIITGIIIRGYIAGISNSVQNQTSSNDNQGAPTALGNILIIIGFALAMNNIFEYIALSPLVMLNIKQARNSASNSFAAIEQKQAWNVFKCWKHEWKVTLFISILAILMEYMTLLNGGTVPINTL